MLSTRAGGHHNATLETTIPPNNARPIKWEYYFKKLYGIFEEQWTKRNEILHGPDSQVEKAETNTATRRLLHYKRHSNDLLSPSDQQFINYPELTIINWSSKRKKDQLRLLNKLHRAWHKDQQLRKAGQKRIYEMAGWQDYNPNPPDPEEEENPPDPPPEPGEEEEHPPNPEAEEENGMPNPPDPGEEEEIGIAIEDEYFV